MDTRIQIVSVLATAGLLGLVFELVRRRALMERYALLWLFASVVLLSLAMFRHALELFSSAVGIAYAPSALFAAALALVLVLLLHFSLVISRLAEQAKVLAQRAAILAQRVDQLEAERAAARRPVALDREDDRMRVGSR